MANEKTIKAKMNDLKSGYIYRICTENKNLKKTELLIGEYFDGFSIIHSIGYWKNIKEKSIIIEISGDKKDFSKVKSLASNICINNKQQTVLIQIEKNKNLFI